MKTVKQDEFDAFIRSIPNDDLECGRDVGRTHGICCYSVAGKVVAVERWHRDSVSDPRVFIYEIGE